MVINCLAAQFWKEVYSRLTVEERMQMEWTEDKIPVDGAWKLSQLWRLENQEKRSKLGYNLNERKPNLCVLAKILNLRTKAVIENWHLSIRNISLQLIFTTCAPFISRQMLQY